MRLKQRVKYTICELGHIPWVAKLAAWSPIRAMLTQIPGVRAIYETGWSRLHPFDRMHGTDTSLTKDDDNRDVHDHAAAPFAHSYAGAQPGPLRAILRILPDLEKSAFIDLGCGKGRPLFVATEFPFREIVGVEYSPQLANVARQNAAEMARRHPERTPVRIEVKDAATYEFPSGNFVLFLYNPFTEPIMEKVAQALARALNSELRDIYVVYCNPTLASYFDSLPGLTRVFARAIAHEAGELGFGPGIADMVTVWRGGSAPELSKQAIESLAA